VIQGGGGGPSTIGGAKSGELGLGLGGGGIIAGAAL
jgi:hypothetical protein